MRECLLAQRPDTKLQWQQDNPEENTEAQRSLSREEVLAGHQIQTLFTFLLVIQLFTYRWHTWCQQGCVFKMDWWYIYEWRLWKHICVSSFTHDIHPSIYYCQKVSKLKWNLLPSNRNNRWTPLVPETNKVSLWTDGGQEVSKSTFNLHVEFHVHLFSTIHILSPRNA